MTPHTISRCQRQVTKWESVKDHFLRLSALTCKVHSTIWPTALCLDNSNDCTDGPFQWRTGTYRWEEKLCSPMSPDSAHGWSIVESKFGEDTLWEYYADFWLKQEVVHVVHVSSDFDHSIHQTWVNSRVSYLAWTEKIWLFQYSLFSYEIKWTYDIIID